MRSECELMTEARSVNGACNVSGLVHGLSRAVTDLWALANARGLGTDWVNRHPVTLLYLEQINYLSGFSGDSVRAAHDYEPSAVKELADAVSVLRARDR